MEGVDRLSRNPFDSKYFELPMGRRHNGDEGNADHSIVMVHGDPAWSFTYRRLIRCLSRHYRASPPRSYRLRFIRQAVKFLWGKNDIALRDTELRRWETALREVEVHEFDDVGHFVQEERDDDPGPLVERPWKQSVHDRGRKPAPLLMRTLAMGDLQKEKIERCLEQFKGSQSSYPFGPEALVYKVMGKMFALMSQLEDVPRVTLKCFPEDGALLIDRYKSVTPGYYMNKKHWITISLTGEVPEALLLQLVDNSYRLVVSKLSKKERAVLDSA